MGALIGARLATNLLKALNMHITQLKMWSDSMIVIHWIRSSSKKWKQFVGNRIMEIQALTPPEIWSHCKGKLNPADLTTRGQSASKLKEDELWWSGPPFLKETEPLYTLPETTEEVLSEEEVQSEQRVSQVAVHRSNSERVKSEPLLQLEKYSKLQTVLRVTAWIQRFVYNCRSKQRKAGELTAEEMSDAEKLWIHEAQFDSFERELNEMKTGKNVHKDSKIRDFNSFIDEHGLICVGGRLQQSDMSNNEQHPWLLPANHTFS